MNESSPTSSSPLAVPPRVGKYVLGRELGAGSTGRVFVSHDPYLDREVAVKLYLLGADMPARKREGRRRLFFNEAQLAGKLDHPQIAHILDAGEEGEICYVVMEYFPGAEALRRRRSGRKGSNPRLQSWAQATRRDMWTPLRPGGSPTASV